MLLELGKYFIRNPLKHYHVVLMFFAAEEIGLYGSNHYVENPVFPLKNIAALINFDMVGTGSEGISIVNGKENPGIVAVIEQINKIGNFFPDIRVGGFSCSSDHCFFARAGVPAIFIFTRGQENQFYHVPDDKIEALPLTKWFELKSLVKEFLIIRDDK
jgi:Zn-dependent M28 family amino/carboxypeptidase